MKFGIFGGAVSVEAGSHDSANYQRFIDYVCEAEDLGFHSVFVVEHHFTGIGQVSATLNLLSYLAAKTRRIRLGTGVTVLPWHNPVLLAEQIATLDLLSNGRADIGVGKGYRPSEFHGFAMPIEEAGDRYEETLDFMIQAWTSKERFSHKGPYWSFNDVVVEPAPVQRPHPPVWVGAGSTPSIQKAASKGLNLLLDQWSTADAHVGRLQTYRDAVAAAGRTYSPARVAVARAIQVTETDAEAEAAIALRGQMVVNTGAAKTGGLPGGLVIDDPFKFAAESSVIGRPEVVIQRLKELEAIGVEYVLLTDAGSSPAALRVFAREVMPAFARTTQNVAA